MPHITPAHLHVLVNHIPIIGLPLVALLLFWGLVRREDAVLRAALLGTILIAAGTWLADYTGDGAKHDIRGMAWASRTVIQAHEQAGDRVNIIAIVTGVAALATLALARGGRAVHRAAVLGVLVLLLVSTVLAAWAGWEGGKIRHAEFGLTPPPAAADSGAQEL